MKGIEVRLGDFRELSKDIESDSIHLIATDPPYGNAFLGLWDDLGRVAARVLAPGRFLVSYSGILCFPTAFDALRRHLDYHSIGGLNNHGPNCRLWCRGVWEVMHPVLFFMKPPVPSAGHRWFGNLLDSPTTDKRYHEWGQSAGPFRYIIERLTDPGELVFDPFLGGGTTAAAAQQLGRRFIGHEIDEDVARIARTRAAGAYQLLLALPDTAEQLVFGE